MAADRLHRSALLGLATVTLLGTPLLGRAVASATARSPMAASAPVRALTINGGGFQDPDAGSSFVLTGTAPVGESVELHFHRAGTAATDFSLLRTVTADGTGFWSRAITADVDYRYYASDAELSTDVVLHRPSPTISGPLARNIKRGSSFLVSGKAVASTTVYLHVHAAGTPSGDYSSVYPVTVDGAGGWSRPDRARSDSRMYVSRTRSAATDYASYLVQAR